MDEGVVQTGGHPAAPERRAPFASASSATIPALDFKGLVRTVGSVAIAVTVRIAGYRLHGLSREAVGP